MFCQCCLKKEEPEYRAACQRHHKFSQTKWARKLYGNLLDNPINIEYVCQHCHTGHASPHLTIWTEADFCFNMNLEPRSKVRR